MTDERKRALRIIGVTFVVALAALLIWDAVSAAEHWQWKPSETATSYRLYWSGSTSEWCEYVEVPCCEVTTHIEPPPPGELVYYVVTAVNQYGESPTEHGPSGVCP